MDITMLGIDIAKTVFQLHGVNKQGACALKKRLSRDKLAAFIANLPTCTIVMESCGGSNYWARVFQSYGHTVKLISPQYVKPFVKTNKNDANDAEAIVEAGGRPSMHFVPIKQEAQQDIQSIHRVRSRLMKNKVALINEMRGILLEYGFTISQGASKVKPALRLILDKEDSALTLLMKELMEGLYEELLQVEAGIRKQDAVIKNICAQHKPCKRLLTIPGVGPLTATAIIASVGDPKVFRNGRHMSAWLGLVPRQHSSGNKQKLLGISKRGDRYLRMLLIHGARAALSRCKHLSHDYGKWIESLACKMSLNKAAVALANKNVRIIWSLLMNKEDFNGNHKTGVVS